MHETGALEPFFRVKVDRQPFERLSVFSMSAYLRSLNEESIELDMPNTVVRMGFLRGMFGV